MILTKSFTYLHHISIYPTIKMMSHASAAKVGTPSTLTPSAAIPSLIVGESRCAVAKSNLKRRSVFQVIFVRRRFRPGWRLQTTSLFLLQQRLALSTFQWNKQRFLRSKSLSYLVVEKKVPSLKLVSTKSVISLNLVQHPGPGKIKIDLSWRNPTRCFSSLWHQ